MRKRISYGLSDFACNIAWNTVGTYLLFFYITTYKLSTAVIGTLFLVVKLIGACFDPIMGFVIDNTKTKWGSSRPYFLWMSIPLCFTFILLFTVPTFSETGKTIYAYITYFLFTIFYTSINLPVTSILPRLSEDEHTRTVFGTYRYVSAICGSVIAASATIPLVNYFGANNTSHGFIVTMILYAFIMFFCFIVAFFNLVESVSYDKKKTGFIKENLLAIKGNIPWLIIAIAGFLEQLISGLRSSSTVFYITYNLQIPEIIPLMAVFVVPGLLMSSLIPTITKKYGLKKTIIFGYVLALIGTAIIALSYKDSLLFFFIGNFVMRLGSGFSFLAYVMLSKCIEYGEKLNNIRSDGLLSSLFSFFQKIGSAVGVAVAGWLLAIGQFNSESGVQSDYTKQYISITYIYLPIIVNTIVIFTLLFYKIDSESVSSKYKGNNIH